jgi:putative peptidoglycan lipid II flippase
LLGARLPYRLLPAESFSMATHISTTEPVKASFAARVARSSASVSVASAVVAVIGFFREVATAHSFGANYRVDAFLIVFTIMSLTPILVSQTMQGVFVPLFTRLRSEAPREAWKLASSAMAYLVVVLAAWSVLLCFARKPLVAFAAPGFGEAASRVAYPMFLVFIPTAILWVLNEFLKFTLNCLSRFFWPSLSQALPGLAAIVTMLLLGRSLGVFSLALGWMLGTVLQSCLLAGHLLSTEFVFDPQWSWSKSALPELLRLSCPYVWVHFAFSFLYFIDRYYASRLPQGAISQLYFADRLLRLPILLFTVPLFTAFHPHISQQAVDSGVASLRRSLSAAMRVAGLVTIPLAVLMGMLSYPIISLIYRGGAFTASDAATTSTLLRYFMPLLFLATAFYILDRVYNVLAEPRTLMKAAFIMLAVKWSSAALLSRHFGVVGLVVSTDLTMIAAVVYLWLLVQKRIGRLDNSPVYWSLAKTVLASAFAGVAIWFCMRQSAFQFQFASGKFSLLCEITGLSLLSIPLFLIPLYAIGFGDVRLVVRALLQR